MNPGLVDETWQSQQPRPSQEAAPCVLLAKGLLPVIYGYVARFLQTHGPGIETGGMLIGDFERTGENMTFRLRGFIEAGPYAECSPESVLFDGDYQMQMLELTRLQHPGTGNMGCIHVHPEQMDVCSEKDWMADVQAVRASDTKALVFAIITINNPRPGPLSLRYRNLKFDFYILSPRTRFEYVHIRPVLEPIPVIRAKPVLSEIASFVNAVTPLNRHYASWPKVLKDKKRLVAEVRAMEERYGGQASLRLEGNRLFWEYTVVESGRHFPIQVRYPRHYPLEPPRIFSLLPLPSSPHQLPGNELCWTNRSGPCEWNPARDTAATSILAAHRWFACLLVYLTLGSWPVEADDGLRFSP